MTTVTHALADADAALGTLVDAVRALPADAGSGPSLLPGWTRGHVLSHVTNVGHAMARQAEHAGRGTTIEPYDGGRAGRDAAIEAGAGRTATQHVAALEAARARLAASWPAPGAPAWSAPVAYRDGVLTDVALAWWREARIHAVDAVVGIDVDAWDDAFCAHLRSFLAERLPDGVRLPDGADAVELEGAPRDVAAWLAGRTPAGPVTARRHGVDVALPELGPWPSSTR
ncbi:maleylpyruvate isomerase family mycothiol-dependent enzyme [Cellulomonas sp. PhB143]|uniref:maleylpyruvate isomerase family mycothiol-dependent enzyme n=1 Tax=Cellulomonas sp. PhB143 TaxID=2485186 RepID=UPI000F4AD9F6|nr:maleylpyruvate isomerase family mycothiol-dependent enzyme [Cellulomonas sp. PhB143]ROS74316.1 maleylpyruvate isomerase [Cellulomonas sp. PhB143]